MYPVAPNGPSGPSGPAINSTCAEEVLALHNQPMGSKATGDGAPTYQEGQKVREDPAPSTLPAGERAVSDVGTPEAMRGKTHLGCQVSRKVVDLGHDCAVGVAQRSIWTFVDCQVARVSTTTVNKGRRIALNEPKGP